MTESLGPSKIASQIGARTFDSQGHYDLDGVSQTCEFEVIVASQARSQVEEVKYNSMISSKDARKIRNRKKALFAIYRSKNEIAAVSASLCERGFDALTMRVFDSKHRENIDSSGIQVNQIRRGAFLGAIIGLTVTFVFYLFLATGLGSLKYFSHFSLFEGFVACMGGLGFGGIIGVVCGALIGIGTPQPIGKRYGHYLHLGGILFSVHCDTLEQVSVARGIFQLTGGQEVHLKNEDITWATATREFETEEHVSLVLN